VEEWYGAGRGGGLKSKGVIFSKKDKTTTERVKRSKTSDLCKYIYVPLTYNLFHSWANMKVGGGQSKMFSRKYR